MRKAYPSDVTPAQFLLIKEELEKAKKRTRPREVDLYEIFCALLYILKNGCTWRALPHDFPNWELVYYYNKIWNEKDKYGFTILDIVWAKLRDMERYVEGREGSPSMLIGDSKSIPNADTARESGYDGGKKNRGS
jgi:transposase